MTKYDSILPSLTVALCVFFFHFRKSNESYYKSTVFVVFYALWVVSSVGNVNRISHRTDGRERGEWMEHQLFAFLLYIKLQYSNKKISSSTMLYVLKKSRQGFM